MSALRRLSAKQLAFVRRFVGQGGNNAFSAAVSAGYGARGAHSAGSRLLQRDYILAAILREPGGAAVVERLARKSRSVRTRITAAMVLHSGAGLRIFGTSAATFVLADQKEAVARRHVLAHWRALGVPCGRGDVTAGGAPNAPGSKPGRQTEGAKRDRI